MCARKSERAPEVLIEASWASILWSGMEVRTRMSARSGSVRRRPGRRRCERRE